MKRKIFYDHRRKECNKPVEIRTRIGEEVYEWSKREIKSFALSKGADLIGVAGILRTFKGRGDLSHKHAAEAAGLGRLGKNSMQ